MCVDIHIFMCSSEAPGHEQFHVRANSSMRMRKINKGYVSTHVLTGRALCGVCDGSLLPPGRHVLGDD